MLIDIWSAHNINGIEVSTCRLNQCQKLHSLPHFMAFFDISMASLHVVLNIIWIFFSLGLKTEI